jgi:processive 1,2-diacylglycerol beta-glucosyltransferase
VTGVPLMPPFVIPPGQVEARRELNLPLDRPTVLVLGGGLGIGLEQLVDPLLEGLPEPVSLVVMTGRNDAVREQMQSRAAAARGRLRLERWTDHMERFVAASDVVVGKPGGLTVAEVLACGRPLFVTRSLRGQESFNVRFLEREGIGRFLSPGDMVPSIAELLADPAQRSAMQKRAWNAGRRDGAARVAAAALQMARPHVGPVHPAMREGLNGYR